MQTKKKRIIAIDIPSEPTKKAQGHERVPVPLEQRKKVETPEVTPLATLYLTTIQAEKEGANNQKCYNFPVYPVVL